MATITKEKVRKINEGCTNGWKLNVEAWVGFNNKVLVYEVTTEDGGFWIFSLRYHPEYKETKNHFGQKFSQKTGRDIPALSVAHYFKGDAPGVFISSGEITFFKVGDAVTRQTVKLLQTLTKEFTEDVLMTYTKKNGPMEQFYVKEEEE